MAQKISMYVPDEMYEALVEVARKNQADYSKLIRMWIKVGLKSYNKKVTDQMPGKGKKS